MYVHKKMTRGCYAILYVSIFLIPVLEAAIDSFLLSHYDLKVSQNEATCRLVNHANLPEDRRTLSGRDCMCDEDCIEYKDCCKDSRFYYPSQQSHPSTYHCSENSAVYLKAQCAADWKDHNMAELCENSLKPLESDDMSLILHVSNLATRTTYGNPYCAACNYDQDMSNWIPWTMGVACGEAPAGYLKKPIVVPNSYSTPVGSNYINNEYDYDKVNTRVDIANEPVYPPNVPRLVLDINLYLYNDSNYDQLSPAVYSFPIKIDANVPQLSQNQYNYPGRAKRQSRTIDFRKYANIADQIALNARYDPYNKKFVSKHNNKDFICEFGSILPENAQEFTRKCVPFLVKSCPKSFKQESVKAECATYTGIVYNSKSRKAYRNKDCARCNDEKEQMVGGAPQDTRADLSSLSSGGASKGVSGTPTSKFVAAG
ncbi:uncharacterized protein LOC135843455 [Planococcus citri]|uniref:uncharacterized protein LOC135843455 n=1 Tax=Planococcus citri TaxID=170843 RepID=UPI0031F94387